MGVSTNKKQTNHIKDDHIHRNAFAQWGIPVILLLIVLIVMVTNFCVISRNEANASINNRLVMEAGTYAAGIERRLSITTSAANAIAAIMADKDKCTTSDIAWYAKKLQNSQVNTYMVVIADNEGKGYSSEGEQVNIYNEDYFAVSRSVRYCITNDDGILNERAYVIAVPYYQENISKGAIYLFISADKIANMLPNGGYDLHTAFAICDSKGKLLGSSGEKTAFTANDQFIENLERASLDDMPISRIHTRLGKQVEFAFEAELNEETKTIICVPIGISDWQYITILNQSYVDKLISNEWKNARNMTIELAIAASAFICMVILIAVINRFQYNERNKELAIKADTDQLTGLNNKMATERKIQEYLERNPDSQCLFFLFDIDNFKKINDTLGHAFGDEVLRSLGQQLSNEFRVTDIIGRTGGDEFILFLKDLNSDEILEKEAKRFADFFHSFQAGQYVKYSATASIGATVFPRDAKDYHGLYTTADSALYEAKRRGKNQMCFYNKSLEAVNPDKKKETPIESDLR